MCASLAKEISRIENIELMPKSGKRLFIKWLGKDICRVVNTRNAFEFD